MSKFHAKKHILFVLIALAASTTRLSAQSAGAQYTNSIEYQNDTVTHYFVLHSTPAKKEPVRVPRLKSEVAMIQTALDLSSVYAKPVLSGSNSSSTADQGSAVEASSVPFIIKPFEKGNWDGSKFIHQGSNFMFIQSADITVGSIVTLSVDDPNAPQITILLKAVRIAPGQGFFVEFSVDYPNALGTLYYSVQ
jgi:hypothetical protein